MKSYGLSIVGAQARNRCGRKIKVELSNSFTGKK